MTIDWTEIAQYPENEAECTCGAVWMTHTKFVAQPSPHIEARKACPACGFGDRVRKSSSGWHEETIKKEDEGDVDF